MLWGRNVSPSKFNTESLSCFHAEWKTMGAMKLWPSVPLNCKEEGPEKRGLVLKWLTFFKPASQPGPLILMPKVPGQQQIFWEVVPCLRHHQAPAWAWCMAGVKQPQERDHSALCPTKLSAKQTPKALGTRFYSCYQIPFHWLCGICLVLNAEPCPEGRGPKAGMQEPEFWSPGLLHHQKNGQPEMHASLFLGFNFRNDKMKPSMWPLPVLFSKDFGGKQEVDYL